VTEPALDTPEDYQFLPRLIGSYLLALVAYMALGKSLYIEFVTVVAWLVLLVHLFLRFRWRALWALAGSPFAFHWAWLLWKAAHDPTMVHPAGAIIV
jgi:urea transporter